MMHLEAIIASNEAADVGQKLGRRNVKQQYDTTPSRGPMDHVVTLQDVRVEDVFSPDMETGPGLEPVV